MRKDLFLDWIFSSVFRDCVADCKTLCGAIIGPRTESVGEEP
jgi:hypothetical protein